jgi:hypothetical protein
VEGSELPARPMLEVTPVTEVLGDVAGDRRGIRRSRPCRSYASGHHVHHIQWSRAWRDPASRAAAEIVRIGEDRFTLEVDGAPIVARHHDLGRLGELVAGHGPRVEVQFAWHVLWFGDHLVSIRRAKPLDPCSDEVVGGALVVAASATETADHLRRAARR